MMTINFAVPFYIFVQVLIWNYRWVYRATSGCTKSPICKLLSETRTNYKFHLFLFVQLLVGLLCNHSKKFPLLVAQNVEKWTFVISVILQYICVKTTTIMSIYVNLSMNKTIKFPYFWVIFVVFSGFFVVLRGIFGWIKITTP
jgi:hypothetical protein